MLNHPDLKGWLRCPSCRYAEDKDGNNMLTKKEEPKCQPNKDIKCPTCKCGK